MSFPLGARGTHPAKFYVTLPWSRIRELTNIPGISRIYGGLAATWDMAEFLAQELGQPCPRPPLEAEVDLEAEVKAFPGLSRYFDLKLNEVARDYQKEDAIFMARRAYCMNCNAMRMGKTLESLIASVLIDARRTLIVCPALAKYVWADEIARWLKEPTLVLEGRGGDIARRYCLTCMARGRVGKDRAEKCPDCKLRNGQSRGFRIYEAKDMKETAPGVYECRRHGRTLQAEPDLRIQCKECLASIDTAIDESRYVCVNYDLLVSQQGADAAGRTYARDDLPGWGPTLGRHSFDLCIGDEMHSIRGWSTDRTKKGTTRRERFNLVTENIPRVWGLTGTPIYGYVRDLWGQLDAISKGALTSDTGLPFSFHQRYCLGHRGEFGWEADGRSPLADTELRDRLRYFTIQRPRNETLKNLPPKTRQTIRIDDTRPSKAMRFGKDEPNSGRIARLIKSSFEVKVDHVVENVMNEMAEGNRSLVFTYARDSAERLAKAIERASNNREHRTRMREVNLKIWRVHGDTPTQVRFEQSRAFREHQGAGVFLSTIDAMQIAISLGGASTVHFAELHWQPAAMLQAEDRPLAPGVTGIQIVYYIVRSSVDEHIEQILMPKIETKDRVERASGAREVRDAFSVDDDSDKSLADLILAMTKNVDLGKYAGDGELDLTD